MSGVAVASACAAVSKQKGLSKALIIFTGAAAGAMPDLDVISLWSGFDSTIGSTLNLTHSGRDIYFNQYWYSHHAISHSLFASLVCTAVLIGLMRLSGRKFQSFPWIYPITFFLAYQMHLLGDLPTPGSVWEGIRYWHPSDQYIGGWGLTWWWNNYDIFLLLILCTTINSVIGVVRLFTLKKALRWVPAGIFAITFILCGWQLGHRGASFNYAEYVQSEFGSFEQRSLDKQREILGDRLFKIMRDFDNSIHLNF